MENKIIPGASYFRVHTLNDKCQLHICGYYTYCVQPRLKHGDLEPCHHDEELTSKLVKFDNDKNTLHLYDDDTSFITVHGRDDKRLAILSYTIKDGAGFGEFLDPRAYPLAQSVEVHTRRTPKEFTPIKKYVFYGTVVGKLQELKFVDHRHTPDQLRSMDLGVDISNIHFDRPIPEKFIPESCCVIL